MADGQLIEREEHEVAVQGDAFIGLIERAISNGADVETIERIYGLSERQQAKAAEKAYYADMNGLQSELPTIEHTKAISYEKGGQTIVKGTYTPWEDIDAQIRPIYIKYGFSLSFEIDQPIDGQTGPAVSCIVMHKDGHKVQYKPMRLPPDPSGSKNSAQAIGSAVSYAKRYSACLALNITTKGAEGHSEDDDGEAAVRPMNPSQARKHELWEKLTNEYKGECATQSDADDWLQRTKQFREEYRGMPHAWRALFYEEVFLPYRENLRP